MYEEGSTAWKLGDSPRLDIRVKNVQMWIPEGGKCLSLLLLFSGAHESSAVKIWSLRLRKCAAMFCHLNFLMTAIKRPLNCNGIQIRDQRQFPYFRSHRAIPATDKEYPEHRVHLIPRERINNINEKSSNVVIYQTTRAENVWCGMNIRQNKPILVQPDG